MTDGEQEHIQITIIILAYLHFLNRKLRISEFPIVPSLKQTLKKQFREFFQR